MNIDRCFPPPVHRLSSDNIPENGARASLGVKSASETGSRVPRLAPGLDHVIADDRGQFRVALQEKVFRNIPPHFLRRFRPRTYLQVLGMSAQSQKRRLPKRRLNYWGSNRVLLTFHHIPPEVSKGLNTVFIVYYYQRSLKRCNLTTPRAPLRAMEGSERSGRRFWRGRALLLRRRRCMRRGARLVLFLPIDSFFSFLFLSYGPCAPCL
jgi:hypothetical protein